MYENFTEASTLYLCVLVLDQGTRSNLRSPVSNGLGHSPVGSCETPEPDLTILKPSWVTSRRLYGHFVNTLTYFSTFDLRVSVLFIYVLFSVGNWTQLDDRISLFKGNWGYFYFYLLSFSFYSLVTTERVYLMFVCDTGGRSRRKPSLRHRCGRAPSRRCEGLPGMGNP